MRRSVPAVLTLVIVTLVPASPRAAISQPLRADLILLHAGVTQAEPPATIRAAVAMREGSIIFVGDEKEALSLRGENTRIADLEGFTLIPGLIDAHGHVSSLGFRMSRLDFVGTKSAEEIVLKVRAAAEHAPRGEWILGGGWDQNDWSVHSFPSRRILDEAAPANPVALDRIDGHALWVNSRALETADVNPKSPDPEGGKIYRDADGFPTGILVDNAKSLVESRIPAPDREQTKRAILRALDRCLDSGLTAVHDAGISMEEAGIYKELAAQGKLPIRVYAMLGGTRRSFPDYFAGAPLVDFGDGYFTLRAIKLGIDGALGSRGAALFEDYTDAPGQRGLVTREPSEIQQLASQAISRGYQVAVHAIGDRGNALALTALEAALAQAPPGDYRFRIEHAQILRLVDVPRFKSAGIIPSMQPTHCTSDMPWAQDRLGPNRLQGAYAWRKLLDTGVRIPAGSDFPVESENPFIGIYAAVTRQDLEGNPRGGWRPEERMTIAEALRAFTLDAAYAAFQEGSAGAIAPGRRADIVVLSAPLLTMPVSEIPKTVPAAVIVGGRVKRSSEALRARLPVENPSEGRERR